MKYPVILGIESSCDETAAAVVRNGREVLSNVISSQIALHKVYGGVVPEIASRKHIENIDGVIMQALEDAKMGWDDIDAIAVTYGPGLVGALLVGGAEAKALAYSLHKPLLGVHHMKGHIAANYITNKEWEPPFLCLVVSGGHTHIVMVDDYQHYRILGKTRDDAAGEAFDKVSRAIGLGYPGGPQIQKAAEKGNPVAEHWCRVSLPEKTAGAFAADFVDCLCEFPGQAGTGRTDGSIHPWAVGEPAACAGCGADVRFAGRDGRRCAGGCPE